MKINILSGNTLKIIAALAMLIDHMGVLLFPAFPIFRIIGRLSFPIFAFMISEGARYTRDKLRYFLSVFILSVLCQAVYMLAGGFEPFNILVTFSFSILIIYALNDFKKVLFAKDRTCSLVILKAVILLSGIAIVYLVTELVHIDYGFAGCLAPVFASIFDLKDINIPEKFKKLDCLPLRILCLFIPIFFVILRNMSAGDRLVSPFLFTALPILLLYSGERGKANMKYFFYLFYPLHLALLEGIQILLFLI